MKKILIILIVIASIIGVIELISQSTAQESGSNEETYPAHLDCRY